MPKGKRFNTLQELECTGVSQRVYDHAQELWASAMALDKSGHRSTGVSIKVVALEEAVKSFILGLDGHGFTFRKLRYFKALNRNHQHRHFIIGMSGFFHLFGKDMQRFVGWLKENHEHLEVALAIPDESEKREHMTQWLLPLALEHISNSVVPKLGELTEWFAQLDDIRTFNLHSSFEGRLMTPADNEASELEAIGEKLQGAWVTLNAWLQIVWEPDQLMQSQLKKGKRWMHVNKGYSWIDAKFKTQQRGGDLFTELREQMFTTWKEVDSGFTAAGMKPPAPST